MDADRHASVPGLVFDPADRLLGPYIPRLVAEWLRERPSERHRVIDSTLVFADISGFTRMTEMLGAQGKIGAEEIADLINSTFEPLLAAAYRYGAGLIKWGGDATLLLFDGPWHVSRACRAAWEMQRVMREVGRIRTSRGPLRLRMSIGAHSGECDFFLVGHDDHRELLVTGPAATILTRMEKVAGPGQIVVSDATATALAAAGERRPSAAIEDGWLLAQAPQATAATAALETVDYAGVDVSVALCRNLREHIRDGGVEHEHRHVAVGFVKFSAVDRLLAEQDPADVLAALEHVVRTAQSVASDNEVTLLSTDIGADGGKLLLCAGAPRRVGGDEDRLIATLRAVVDAREQLPLAAGMTVGRVFAGDYGPPFRRTYSLMGDCVNLAARLMAHAGDGEVLATEEVIRASSGAYAASPREAFVAKGKQAPVTPLSIGSPLAASERARSGGAEAPELIGRDAELGDLLAVAGAAAQGSGSVAELIGEPGMGKSRLLIELRERTDARVLWAEGDVYAANRPYAAFERLLRDSFGAGPDVAPEELARRLQAVTRERAPHLLPWLPLIAIAGGLELPSTPEVEQTDPTLRKVRLEELTSELLGLLLPGPTVLVFNDVRLMDDASRDLISRLAQDALARPWAVIVSRRPDGPSPVAGLPAQRIELRPLAADAAEQLLARATVDAPLPPQRLADLARRAAGNPLFLRELVAELRAGNDPDSLPQSVEASIAARIDRLPSGDRRTLRSAAVLGMDIEAPLLAEVLAIDERSAVSADDRLAALSEFIEPAGPQRHRFAQQLVREVAYEGLPYRRRTELHARTAAAIERIAGADVDQHAELLSVHCLHGARYEAAWGYSRRATQRARARYANAEAAQSCRQALAAAAHLHDLEPPELAEVETELGDISVELGELAAADAALRRAHRRLRATPVQDARVELKLAHLREVSGAHAAALRWVQRAERSLEGIDDADARAVRGQALTRRARISYRRGRHKAALAFAEAAIELARETSDLRTLATALEYADLSAVELGIAAGARAEQALAIYEELGDLGAEARVRNSLGMLAYYRGAWPAALEHYRASESAFTRAGKRWEAALPAANAAEILADQGRLSEAREALERAMLVWRAVNGAEIAFGEYQLASIAARSGQTEDALGRFAAAREHFRASGEVLEVVIVDALTAECHRLAGRPEAALELADDTLARAHALGGVATITPLLQRVRGGAFLALGRRDDADQALRQGLETARSRDAGHEVALTLDALCAAGLARDAAEAETWNEELATLSRMLGLQLRSNPGGQASRA
jgi:class 3 adenylate cyclase/tetratricopeptide (TPR) repeat protein